MRVSPCTAAPCLCTLGPGSRQQGLEDGNDWVLVGGHHQHAAELVEEHEQLRAPGVLIVHDLLQVVAATEVLQQPGGEGGTSPQSKTELVRASQRLRRQLPMPTPNPQQEQASVLGLLPTMVL